MAPVLPGGFYVGGTAGWAHLGTIDEETNGIDRNRWGFGDGFGLGARAGVQTGPLRFEGEFTYRHNPFDSINGVSAGVHGSMQSFAFMANGIYDFPMPLWGGVTPHVGGGIGAVNLDLGHKGSGNITTETQFGYQALAGVSVPLTPSLSLDLDYRYLATTDPTFRNGFGARLATSYSTHNLGASLIYHFGAPPP